MEKPNIGLISVYVETPALGNIFPMLQTELEKALRYIKHLEEATSAK